MMHPTQNIQNMPFLVDIDNAPFLAGTGLATPQRCGSGMVELAIGGLMGGTALSVPLALILLGIPLNAAAVMLVAAGTIGGLIFAGINLRSGWRSVRRAHAYRTRARRVDGTFTALELVDEGSGDWFLKGRYQFIDEAGGLHQGTFAQYRYDLAKQPLPPVGTRAVVLVLDVNQHTVL